MKNNITKDGYAYLLRPIELKDAKFILEARLEDEKRNKFIHKISEDISAQEKWLKDYFERDNDYYFVLENKITSAPEGLISIYNIDFQQKTAEWGRWVIKKNSFGAIESVNLMMEIAFDDLGLKKIFSRTVVANESVVSFHDSIGEEKSKILPNYFELDGHYHDAIDYLTTKEHYYSDIEPKLSQKSSMISEKLIKQLNIK